jgi:hypothetical protein
MYININFEPSGSHFINKKLQDIFTKILNYEYPEVHLQFVVIYQFLNNNLIFYYIVISQISIFTVLYNLT